MEGRSVLLIGALALVALIVVLAFFLSSRAAPYVPATNASTSTTAVTSVYTSTIIQTRNTVATTTIPVSMPAAWQRFDSDLGLFRNVTAIALTYNATSPDSVYENGSDATFYKYYGNVSFQTYYTIQNFTLPVIVYKLGGGEIVCATLPSPLIGTASSCAAENVSFPNMANFMSLNASAYSNVTYEGASSVGGDACDSFSATVSSGEAERLIGNATAGKYSADMCINTQYGYPDYLEIHGAGTGSDMITYEGGSQQVPSSYLQPPSDFAAANATCSASLIKFTFTPFYNFTDPSFALSGAMLNSSELDLEDAAANADMAYTANGLLGAVTQGLLSNSSNQSNLTVQNQEDLYGSGYGNYSSQQLWNEENSNMSYDILDYQNGTVYDALPGPYTALHSYQVTLPARNLVTALGFSLCDANGCQAVLTC